MRKRKGGKRYSRIEGITERIGDNVESNRDVQLRIAFSQDFSSDETKEITESFSKILPTIENRIATDSEEILVKTVIVFVILHPIVEEFLKSIGSDLYNKAKEKIIKILNKKKNPTLAFQFRSAYKGTDIVIKAQTNDKEELSKIFDTIDKAREIAMRERDKKEAYIITVNYDNDWTLDSEKSGKS